jgi:hypothetical protein
VHGGLRSCSGARATAQRRWCLAHAMQNAAPHYKARVSAQRRLRLEAGRHGSVAAPAPSLCCAASQSSCCPRSPWLAVAPPSGEQESPGDLRERYKGHLRCSLITFVTVMPWRWPVSVTTPVAACPAARARVRSIKPRRWSAGSDGCARARRASGARLLSLLSWNLESAKRWARCRPRGLRPGT